ncbi:MAG: hypothetical protein ACFFBP_22775 [Promethearchaeota archaeon]
MTKKKKIIIFEDEQDITLLTAKTMQIAGFETIICLNSQEALEVLKKEYMNITCILMNAMMSGRDPYDFLKEIASKKVYQEIPIFMIGEKILDKIFPLKDTPSKKFSFLKNLNSDINLTDFLNELRDNQEDDDAEQNEED